MNNQAFGLIPPPIVVIVMSFRPFWVPIFNLEIRLVQVDQRVCATYPAS